MIFAHSLPLGINTYVFKNFILYMEPYIYCIYIVYILYILIFLAKGAVLIKYPISEKIKARKKFSNVIKISKCHTHFPKGTFATIKSIYPQEYETSIFQRI